MSNEQLPEQQIEQPIPALNIPVESESEAPDVPATPEAEQQAAETATAPEQSQTEQQDAADEPSVQEDDQPKKPNRTAQYIDRLKEQRNDAKREAEAARAELMRLQERMSQPVEYDEYDDDARQAHTTRQVLDEQRAEDAQTRLEAAQEAAWNQGVDAFYQSIEANADRFPNLANEFNQLQGVTPVMAETLMESDLSAELAHWMVSNPQEVARMATLPPAQQIRHLALQEGRIAQAPKARKVSQAPPPPPQVTSAASPSQKDPADMSMEEYAAYYRKREGQG